MCTAHYGILHCKQLALTTSTAGPCKPWSHASADWGSCAVVGCKCSRYQEELELFKTKETNEDDEDEGVKGTLDALDLLKRVFQLKRFMGGDNNNGTGEGPSNAGTSGSASANAFQIDEAPTDPEESLVQAGCTAVVAVKRGNELFVANAGDSRGVLCRAGKAVALSEDHKPAQETERSRIIAAGGFLSEIGGVCRWVVCLHAGCVHDAEVACALFQMGPTLLLTDQSFDPVCRVNGNLNLSRAIGDLKYKGNTELPPKDQIITAQPDVRRITLTSEDRFFLLACDGVWDVMSNQVRHAAGHVASMAGTAHNLHHGTWQSMGKHCAQWPPSAGWACGCAASLCFVGSLR